MRDIRLYLDSKFSDQGTEIDLDRNQAHYLTNVMRVGDGEAIRVFNGHDGEWRGVVKVLSKKSVLISLDTQFKPQDHEPEIHLHFAPLKQSQQSFLIEKATELGVTNFHPMLTERTVVRAFKGDKQRLTAIEAAEQCERLTVPEFHNLVALKESLTGLPETHHIYACDERRDAPKLTSLTPQLPAHIVIGPEGGFTDREFSYIQGLPNCHLVMLHKNILRAETAALTAISQLTSFIS